SSRPRRLRPRTHFRVREVNPTMDVLYACCCGLDVHRDTVVACLVRSVTAGGRGQGEGGGGGERGGGAGDVRDDGRGAGGARGLAAGGRLRAGGDGGDRGVLEARVQRLDRAAGRA